MVHDSKKYHKEWYQKNKKSQKEKMDKWRRNNRDKMNVYQRKYKENNKRKCQDISNYYRRKRYSEDINYRLQCVLRSRFYKIVNENKYSCRSIEMVGCSIEDLKKHLENLFTNGMSWDNYGEWEIDHIIPCSSFNMTLEDDQRKCFHYTNLQPLWKTENRKKLNKIL